MVELLREHRAEIKAAAAAGNVQVFGPVARGEDTPESDVDLLVDFPASERAWLAEAISLWAGARGSG